MVKVDLMELVTDSPVGAPIQAKDVRERIVMNAMGLILGNVGIFKVESKDTCHLRPFENVGAIWPGACNIDGIRVLL